METKVVKNYSDSNTPNAHARISVHDDKSVHIVSDYGVTSLVSNSDLMNSEPLDLTYINNKYVGIESFNRVRSAKITPTLAILSLNLAVENFPHNNEFINIGKINGATVLVTTLANVPAQNGKGVLTYQIDSNGNIAIHNDTSETINSFCRVMIPLVGRF